MTVPVVRFTFRNAPDVAPHVVAGSRPWTVVYDGQCRMCGKLVKLLQAWDRRHCFETVPFQDPATAARFTWIPAASFRDALQLVGPGNQTFAGAAAIDRILDLLPAGWLFGWAFRIPVLGRLLDRLYRWVARNRYRLGCGEHCAYRPRV